MAGEWLKLECSTPDKPEVFAITASMGWDDPDMTVGKLFRVWRWFDQQTVSGNAPGVTCLLLDRIAGATGFAQAMEKAGWLIVSDTGLQLPNFEKHNGSTAKNRAQTAKRVAEHRATTGCNANTVTETVTPPLAREEKRREEKKEQKTTPDGELFSGVPEQIAHDFKQLRQKLRAPITPTAMDGMRREAGKAGMTLAAALAMCCERGWRGFKAEWVTGTVAASGQPPKRRKQLGEGSSTNYGLPS